MENTKKLGANAPVSIVNGFPARNDGTLVYDEKKRAYELDADHMFQLAKSIGICASRHQLGAVIDDRTKKNGRSFVKDSTFMKQNPGVADLGKVDQISAILKMVISHGILQKCDVNYDSHRNTVRKIDSNSRRTHLIFAFFLEHEYVQNMTVNKDLYVKFCFTETKKGAILHLDSLHYGHI